MSKQNTCMTECYLVKGQTEEEANHKQEAKQNQGYMEEKVSATRLAKVGLLYIWHELKHTLYYYST